jgi:signal transduction histidine kinase
MAKRLEPLADPALAVATLVLSLLPLLAARDCGCDPAPTWAFVLVAVECAPLAVRRRWPFGATLVIGAMSMAYGVANLPDPPVAYATLVGLYTVAAHASRRKANVAAVLAGVGLVSVVLWDKTHSDYQDLVVNAAVFATAWLLGDSARNRRDRAVALEARAAQLERTRAAEAEAAVVAERNRIAREMHDVVAHHVSMMVVQAEAGPVAMQRDPAAAAAAFDTISAVGKQALAEMRRLLGVLKTGEDMSFAPVSRSSRTWWTGCGRPVWTWSSMCPECRGHCRLRSTCPAIASCKRPSPTVCATPVLHGCQCMRATTTPH